MECPSLLDILGFLELPSENIDLESNKIIVETSQETQLPEETQTQSENMTNEIGEDLEKKQKEYIETNSNVLSDSENIISGGSIKSIKSIQSAQGDSTQIKVITLGSKKFVYSDYAPKRKSAKKHRRR